MERSPTSPSPRPKAHDRSAALATGPRPPRQEAAPAAEVWASALAGRAGSICSVGLRRGREHRPAGPRRQRSRPLRLTVPPADAGSHILLRKNMRLFFLIVFRMLRFKSEKYPPRLGESIHSHHRVCCVSAGTTHFRHRDEREREASELCAASQRGEESSPASQLLGRRPGPQLGAQRPRRGTYPAR